MGTRIENLSSAEAQRQLAEQLQPKMTLPNGDGQGQAAHEAAIAEQERLQTQGGVYTPGGSR